MEFIGVFYSFDFNDPNPLSSTREFIQAQADEWLCDRESGEIHKDTPTPLWVIYGSHRSGFEDISDEELTKLGKKIIEKSVWCAFGAAERSEA